MKMKLKSVCKEAILPLLTTVLFLFCGCFDAAPEAQAPAEAPVEESAPAEAAGEDWGYLSEAQLAKLPKPTEQPPLEVSGGLEHEVGVLMEGEIKVLNVMLKNIGAAPWKIQEIDTNCDCTNIDGIPGGLVLQPGEEWKMRVRIDSNRLPLGKFRREVIVRPLKYLPVRIAFSGEVKRFAVIMPANKQLKFPVMSSPGEKWEVKAMVNSADGAEPLKLKSVENPAGYLRSTLKELAPGKWEVTVSPARALPFAGGFTEKVAVAVEGDGKYPQITFTVKGICGARMNFSPASVTWQESEDGNDELFRTGAYIGFDPYSPDFTDAQMNAMQKLMETVDFEYFKKGVEFQAPAGVTVTKSLETYCVRLQIAVEKRLLKENPSGVTVNAVLDGSRICQMRIRAARK